MTPNSRSSSPFRISASDGRAPVAAGSSPGQMSTKHARVRDRLPDHAATELKRNSKDSQSQAERMRRLKLGTHLQRNLKFLHVSPNNLAGLLNNLKPFQMTKRLGGFRYRRLSRLRKTGRGRAYQLDKLISCRHLSPFALLIEWLLCRAHGCCFPPRRLTRRFFPQN